MTAKQHPYSPEHLLEHVYTTFLMNTAVLCSCISPGVRTVACCAAHTQKCDMELAMREYMGGKDQPMRCRVWP